MVGSVSGGCVEGAVVESALAAIASGRHELLDFGVTDEMAWEVGLACGGKMQVFVDRVAASGDAAGDWHPWLDELQSDRAAKRAAVLGIDLHSGRRQVLHPGTLPDEGAIATAVRDVLRTDAARLLEREPTPLFLQPFNPPLRLVIVGAVHIAQPLCRMAAETGYAVTVVDPRGAFASKERFPGIELCPDWPDEALEALAIDARTAIVTLTHDPKLDDPALAIALHSPAFYVGSLGSRRTHTRRLERLAEEGFDDAALARIHAPVGLDIGARSASEIAVSILAEITQCLRERCD
jgi:xanthine dehydrogenase accessory factor